MADDKLAKINQETSMVAPDFLQNEKPEGLEHLTEQDVAMPRLLIAQQMSPQLAPDKPQYMEDLRPGQMFNSLTGRIYGKGPIRITVIRADTPRWVEFIPREMGGGIRDPKVPFGDPRTEFGPDGKPPIATKFYDFIVWLHDYNELVALSFKSTGLKTARQLNGLMQARMKPIWTGVYALAAVSTTNTKGTFFIPMVKNAGWIDKEQVPILKPMFEGLKHRVIDIDMPEARGHDAEEEGDASFNPTEYDKEAAAATDM